MALDFPARAVTRTDRRRFLYRAWKKLHDEWRAQQSAARSPALFNAWRTGNWEPRMKRLSVLLNVDQGDPTLLDDKRVGMADDSWDDDIDVGRI